MNKSAIRHFASQARRDLIEQVILRASELGITASGCNPIETGSDYVVIAGNRYPLSYKQAYDRLCTEWKTKGFDQLVEEVAYTWFNRILAIRYMEIHDYLPSHLRVLSSGQAGALEPQVLSQYRDVTFNVEISFMEQALLNGDREGAYRHLLIGQCDELYRIMPFLFEPIADYTELLLPTRLLHADSIIQRLVRDIAEEDFAEVEIIGWMYQFYIVEKQKSIVGMNKGFVSKEDLPAATQLFTPNWIVRYMIQNSLGRYWTFDNGQSELVANWEYYLAPHEHLGDVQTVNLAEIKILDPACGSGHILVYAFDLLFQMYESQGYLSEDIPKLILANNLYGLDIDRRAAQLASFALVMKARQKDRRFFSKNITVQVHEFHETCEVSDAAIELLCTTDEDRNNLQAILETSQNAKIFGSLLSYDCKSDGLLERLLRLVEIETPDLYIQSLIQELLANVHPILVQAKWLSMRYDVVATNPPYHNKYSPELKEFITSQYKNYKSDLYSAFIYRCMQMTKYGGYVAMMTPFTWMFISTHEKLRSYLLKTQTITSLIQMEYNSGFEEAAVPICTFVIQNQTEYQTGEYIRLAEFRGFEVQPIKVLEAVKAPNVPFRYSRNQNGFLDIPGSPIAYWAPDHVREVFRDSPKLSEVAQPRQGLATADNARFIRMWHEVDVNRIGFALPSRDLASASGSKWFPLNKGGDFRKWYGNQDYVLNWENDGHEIRNFDRAVIRNPDYYFREGITWTDISSSKLGVRYSPVGFIFSHTGNCVFPENSDIEYLMGFMCSKVCYDFLGYLNPTMHFLVGNVASLPIVIDKGRKAEIVRAVQTCVQISKDEWDSFETSWNFVIHPFLAIGVDDLPNAFDSWKVLSEDRFKQLRNHEMMINDAFSDIYGLDRETVTDDQITITRAERVRDAKSFLSYFIGCVMGRYSLDHPGLAYAGGNWDEARYLRFLPDVDGIIPLTDDVYFEDDIIHRLSNFLTAIYGIETLQDNLRWLAESIGGTRNGERPVDRIRRYFCDEFYKDHVKTYSKRPIYWLFDSGSKKAFRALIYLHRYDTESVARVRLQYVQALQRQYAQELILLNQRLQEGQLSGSERTATTKRIRELEDRQIELTAYDQRLAGVASDRIVIDLDDGVVVNHAKFADVLAPLK